MNCMNKTTLAVCLLDAVIAGNCFGQTAAVSAKPLMLHAVAVAAVRPAGAPEYDDVCFRYGWIRTPQFPTVEDAKMAMRAFHATRVDWFYPGSHTAETDGEYVTPASQDFIDWCHINGMKIGGAINSNTKNLAWKLVDASWGRYVGDPRITDYANAAVAWGQAQIDAGVDVLVCDDFFGYSTAALKQSFSDNVIEPIKAHQAGFKIAGNSGSIIGTEYVAPYSFDFHYSDINFVPSPGEWWEASKAHRAENSAVLTHPNIAMAIEMHKTQIALGYATGAHVITPWDEYIHNGDRLYTDPADFAGLYGFVRALGQQGYLNGYEDAAVGGYDLTETRYGIMSPIAITNGSGMLAVFGRAQPDQADAPVVFHLVESGTPQSATLRLHIPALFGTSKVDCSLLTPPAYTAAVHAAAENSGNYEALSHAATLTCSVDDDVLVVDVSAVTPWGVLVIAPATNSHSMLVSPVSAIVFPGETQNFTAIVVDTSGHPVFPQPSATWTVSGGGFIDGTGGFTAGAVPGQSSITAKAIFDGETVIRSQTVYVESDGARALARWCLEGDALDSEGTHHGSVQGGAGFSSDRKEGANSILLDGLDDYVQIPDHADLDIGTGDFSYAFWFKREANVFSNLRLISKGGQTDSDTGYCVFGSDTTFSVVVCNGETRQIVGISHGGVGVWTHLAVTIDRTGGLMKVYTNGAWAAETDISEWYGQDLSTTHDLRLGRSPFVNLFWDGRLDDVRVYKRVLSSGEVPGLLNPNDSTPPEPNPMTWSVAPYSTGTSSIRMVATTDIDTNGVQYWFDETSGNPGGNDSGWQDSPVFEDAGLIPGTAYKYRLKARDKAADPNATAFSASLSATAGSQDSDGLQFILSEYRITKGE